MANVLKTYRELKAKHPDALLLFRCGDFYETYEQDAKVVSEVLGITLTKRTGSPKGEGYMAGFPHHALDSYLPKIIRAGHRVAICDIPEPPKKLVRRGSDELTTTATNNPTDNNSKSQETMKLNLSNTKSENQNVQNAQVNNTAIAPIKVAEGSVPMSPEAFRAEYPDVVDADFEEVTDNVPQKAQKAQKAASKRGQSGAGSDSAEREQARPEVKQPISEAPQTQPVSEAKPSPSTGERGEGLPQVQFSTYKTKKGDTAPQIIGFAGEDDPRWKAVKESGAKWVSAGWKKDLNGNKVYILLFGTRYMDVAKALAGAYNTPDVDAWRRAEDACMAIYEQAQRDGKARWEEKKQQWAEKKAASKREQSGAGSDSAEREQARPEVKAEKAAQKAADEQAKKCYTKEDVAAMLADVLAGKDVPEDIKALLAKAA